MSNVRRFCHCRERYLIVKDRFLRCKVPKGRSLFPLIPTAPPNVALQLPHMTPYGRILSTAILKACFDINTSLHAAVLSHVDFAAINSAYPKSPRASACASSEFSSGDFDIRLSRNCPSPTPANPFAVGSLG